MERAEATRILEEALLKTLTPEERGERLASLWSECSDEHWFDDEDPAVYTDDIRADMLANESPQHPGHPRYDPVLRDLLQGSFRGVVNAYLLRELSRLGVEAESIIGEPERMVACPCCRYLTIPPGDDGFCAICMACFWQDSPGGNHVSLRQARENFEKHGAMEPRFLGSVDPDAREKYARKL
ncbi:MAG: CPCC family cysteine-rich protein [Acidobacteriota bacterium]